MPLPRLQLFEFNDLDAAPAPLGDLLVESRNRARTIVNVSHHFLPSLLAAAILAHAVRGSAGIFVSEVFDRTCFEGILWVLGTAAPWSARPRRYGSPAWRRRTRGRYRREDQARQGHEGMVAVAGAGTSLPGRAATHRACRSAKMASIAPSS